MKPNLISIHRSGVTTVEFALTAPILFLLLFAGIEFSRANMLLHTAAIAATEGARRGIISGASAEDCRAAAAAELSAVGISNASIAIKPKVISDETEMISVGVAIPIDATNGYVTPKWFIGSDVIRVVSITREAKSTENSVAQAEAADRDVIDDLQNGGGEKIKSNNGKGKAKGKAKAKGKP